MRWRDGVRYDSQGESFRKVRLVRVSIKWAEAEDLKYATEGKRRVDSVQSGRYYRPANGYGITLEVSRVSRVRYEACLKGMGLK